MDSKQHVTVLISFFGFFYVYDKNTNVSGQDVLLASIGLKPGHTVYLHVTTAASVARGHGIYVYRR